MRLINRGTQLIAITKYGEELIVDDKSVEGETLGIRRLMLSCDPDIPMLKISRAIYSIRDFMKHPAEFFLDSEGRFFKYKKQHMVKVHYHKIIDSISYSDCTILLLEGIHCPIKSDRPPMEFETYAGLLHIAHGYILYDFSTWGKPSYNRKI